MSSKKTLISVAVGGAFAAALSISPVATAASNPFAMQSLSKGYMVADADMPAKAEEGKCGADKAKAHEAKCGAAKAKMHEGKCGEGKCGAKRKANEGKCGADKAKMHEGKCGADKAKAEEGAK
jgi:uncharacterized low-complexity protein